MEAGRSGRSGRRDRDGIGWGATVDQFGRLRCGIVAAGLTSLVRCAPGLDFKLWRDVDVQGWRPGEREQAGRWVVDWSEADLHHHNGLRRARTEHSPFSTRISINTSTFRFVLGTVGIRRTIGRRLHRGSRDWFGFGGVRLVGGT